MATSYYFWGLQRMGLLRGREKMVYWCMPLFLPCFLSSVYHFLSFSPFFLFLVSYYSLAISCSPFGLSFSSVPLWVPPLLSTSLRCSPPPLGTSSVSSMATSSFYSEHIQWEFSFFTPRASPTIFGLLWTFLQDYPPTYWMPSYDLCLEYVYCTTTHFMTKFSFVCSCCIPLPLGSNG